MSAQSQPQSQSQSSSHSPFHPRGSARARSRGGLGKYLRARGRGHRGGRPAEFKERLLLECERPDELSEDESAEQDARYAKRALRTNADRYEEPEPEIGSDGQPIADLEVDMSAFIARQRLEDPSRPLFGQATTDDDDDVDPSLAHINPNSSDKRPSTKGKVQQIEWDASLEEMEHNKNAAQARSDMKGRLRASAARQMGKTATREHAGRQGSRLFLSRNVFFTNAPPLPGDPSLPAKSPRAEMEDFLDNLLN
ncbi:hypothetical protein BJY52DRAFT_1121345 [Lactarius psammicola]|nr:hypothetical protein BJY52DRAFT_1121345 [Lactarius psammicola]